ncbi:ribonucleotide-diphosphate reductase subunit alpha [Pseudoalteromonas phage pYD6-A]|uniref:Ribonucleotide-diphosphate reductase subunit alpha n=1 Tax=Pseudoalteromonas phage pYD6-A TaxID=754052 RepID=M4SQL2_9CAUD|nr:ribonucleotide-diphosphate reductase subunit alpha [Pseudoalteromonas phage pYD6-A]AGH57595.1 ribonucleotide-diphosphate reductase subunit alpha [Pseudoalteromonas phage pYD6-A]
MDLTSFLDETTQRTVTKKDGRVEPWDSTKIERWAQYAARHKVDWKEIYDNTVMRLPMSCTTEEIHYTMIQVCLDKEDIDYSRVAARLLYGELRKNLANIGLSDRMSFTDLHERYKELKLWTIDIKNPEIVNDWYRNLYHYKLEYWQVKQWMDKYSLQFDDLPVETPHAAILAQAISIHGETAEAFKMANYVLQGLINLPTPVLNGCRNGDFDSISCSVISGGDSVDSIGVAEHLAYKMTAKKAGIGIRMNTRSKGDAVKGGAVKHLGKAPIYATIDKAVKMFTQVTRGGSATVTYSVYDPEILTLLNLKSQKTPENKRIDKLDYSLAYDNKFIDAVVANEFIDLVSTNGVIHETISAREVLKAFLTVRQDTGRVYCVNLDTMNNHTPFIDAIEQSNLCMEIALPTKPYENMQDLYDMRNMSQGEMAFCTLSAINVGSKHWNKVDLDDLYFIVVLTLNRIIDKAPMFASSLKANLELRRSLGVGITGLAEYLYNNNLTYADTANIETLSESHYYHLLKASQEMLNYGYPAVGGIDVNWLPIDTKATGKAPTHDWELLRGKPRANSVLAAHMPCESSAQSRKGSVQYIAPPVRELAWDIPTSNLYAAYAAVQAYTDQAISADTYITPNRYPNGKVPLSVLMKEFVMQAKLGIKTLYYVNTNDVQKSFHDTAAEEGCDTCKM